MRLFLRMPLPYEQMEQLQLSFRKLFANDRVLFANAIRAKYRFVPMKTGIRAASMLTASYSPGWQSGPDRFAWRNDKYRGQGANRLENAIIESSGNDAMATHTKQE